MLITNHVLAGAAVGALFRRPAVAMGAGMISHLLMDSMPHWGLPRSEAPDRHQRFLRVARPDGLAGLAIMTTLAVASGGRRRTVVAGMIGAVLPDIDKPAEHFFGRNPVPGPLQRFHDRIQVEAAYLMPLELAIAGTLAVAAVRRLRRGN
ncbi:MAG: hypothetical protein ACRDV9_15470 [Acidimicrobiia bacterium]